MKKVLFATTALIATAGMAAADVRLSGYGRFGLDYNEANGNNPAIGTSTTLTTRLRLQFDMSTETDAGVTLGGRFRIQSSQANGGANSAATANGGRLFASYGGFTLQVGNIVGALEGMSGLYLETASAGTGVDGMGFHSLVTNVGAAYFNWDSYSSAGAGAANAIEVIYSAGAFGAHASYSSPAGGLTDRAALSMYYTFGDWTAALAVQDSDTLGEDKVVVTLAGDLGFAGVRVAYAQNKDAAGLGNDVDKVGLYGVFDIGAATTLVAWVTNEDNPLAPTDGTSYGLNVSHDLGGGASFEAGFVEHSNDNTQAQAGVFFRF